MQKHTTRGFVGTILSIIIALILLKIILHIDVLEFIKSPGFQEVFGYFKKFFILLWEKFLVLPASFLWNEIMIDIIWGTAKDLYHLMTGWVDAQ